MLLNQIQSPAWQISVLGAGNIEQGLDDIRQCLDLLLRTQKGADPLRPEFGTNIFRLIDSPVNIAIPNVKREIIQAVAMFEQRVEIVSISHILNVSHVIFDITYKVVDDDLLQQLQLYYNGGTFVTGVPTPQNLVLEAAIPDPYQQLFVSLIVDGAPQLPIPPSFGFNDPNALFNWCLANWGFLGTWYLLPGKIVLYMKNGIATSASLTITSKAIYKYSAAIPSQLPGEEFYVDYSSNGVLFDEVGPFTTIALMLKYMQDNYGSAGTWVIDTQNMAGDFLTLDFNDQDFNTMGYAYFLTLYSVTLANASIEVIKL